MQIFCEISLKREYGDLSTALEMTLVAARDDKREIWGAPRGKGLEAPTSAKKDPRGA